MQQYLDFAVRNWTLFALLGVILVLFIGSEVMRRVRGGDSVSTNEALRLFNDENALMIDVQEVGEYREAHLPEAKNMPLSTFGDKVGELKASHDRPVVVYCRSGNRSLGACSKLRKNGFQRVMNLSGGILAWQNANLPTAKGRK